MTTKDDILKEFPQKRVLGEIEDYPDFLDLKRMLVALKFDASDLELLKREVIARRESFGLHPGVNKRKTIDGVPCYVRESE